MALTTKTKRPYADVLVIAEELREVLRPACERIEIAGSLRRRRPEVGDIELVAIPIVTATPAVDIFGNQMPVEPLVKNALWTLLDQMGVRYSKKGERYRQFSWKDVQVDLFTAQHGNWGLLFLIRTGPVDFSREIVTRLLDRGTPSDGGWVRSNATGDVIETPAEEDVFRLANREYVHHEKRN